MASRKSGEQGTNRRVEVPTEDEADIIEEVGAERDEETGELVVSEEAVREAGALDTESIRTNRRLEKIANKKLANEKNIVFNTTDIFEIYDTLLRSWLPDNLIIEITRLTGLPVQQTITSRPKSSADLYEMIKVIHGQHPEAEFKVRFKDTATMKYRGTGRIVMPDTRPPNAQQGQPPMAYQYPPQPWQQPPPATSQPTQQAPQQPPQVFVQPPTGPDPMAMFRQMFELVQSVQLQAQPMPQQPPMQPMPYSMPAPPTSPDPTSMMQWFREMLEVVRQVPPQHPGAQPPQPQPHTGPMLPRTPPPAGFVWQWLPNDNTCVAIPDPTNVGSTPARGPYRPPYYSQGDRGAPPYYPQGIRGGPQPYAGTQAPPSRQQSAAEQFRDALSVVRTAVDAVNEFDSLIPGRGGGHVDEAPEVDDDAPVRIVKSGDIDLVYDRNNNLRGWESLLSNIPAAAKWFGEQRELIQRAADERRRKQEPQQRLPPGYVEVGPGYQPPPGYVAVPVDQIPPEEELPPPPAEIPPPIQQSESKRSWGSG